jgi:hypothetical protein
MVMMAMSVGLGQQIGPRFLDRSFQRPGARAMGMGGAYLLATDDATAVAWNPAALVNVKRFTLPIEVAGRAKNFRVQDIRDLIDDLKTIRDQINNPNATPQQIAQLAGQAIREVRDFAQRHGAVPNGPSATLTGALAPVAGLTFGAYGLTVSSGTFGQVQVFVDQANDPDPNDNINLPAQSVQNNPINRSVYARGGVVAVSSLALAHARPLPMGWNVGVAVRGVRADFQAFAAAAGVDNGNIPSVPQGIAFTRVHRTRYTLDVGALWEPTVQPPSVKVKYAAVVRNLLPVRFNLPAVDLAGNPVAGFNFSFRLSPEIDLGVMAKWRERTNLVLELHNVTSSNGGGISVHAGVEHWLAGDVFAVRAGYDDDRPVFGLGINLKVVRIDVAAGLKPRERLAVGVSFRF